MNIPIYSAPYVKMKDIEKLYDEKRECFLFYIEGEGSIIRVGLKDSNITALKKWLDWSDMHAKGTPVWEFWRRAYENELKFVIDMRNKGYNDYIYVYVGE